jgi:hypothetical protein
MGVHLVDYVQKFYVRRPSYLPSSLFLLKGKLSKQPPFVQYVIHLHPLRINHQPASRFRCFLDSIPLKKIKTSACVQKEIDNSLPKPRVYDSHSKKKAMGYILSVQSSPIQSFQGAKEK